MFPDTVGQVAQFQCRLFLLVQALIFGDLEGKIGALFRALVGLLGGIRWFVSCDIGVNHCRLWHLGWEKCGHGLTSKPRESASEGFLNELLVLFGYPSGSASVLLGGELSLRYCSHRFACRVPTRGLPSHGHVWGLVTKSASFQDMLRGSRVGRAWLPGFFRAWVSGGSRTFRAVKRVRLHRKTPAHLTGYVGDGSFQSRPRVWKRLMAEDAGFRPDAAKAARLHLGVEAHGPQDRVGVG